MPHKRAKDSSSFVVPPVPHPTTQARIPCPIEERVAKKKVLLDCTFSEGQSQLLEEGEGSLSADLLKGLHPYLDMTSMDNLPQERGINLFTSYLSREIM
ncbi:UNVERIFIED_CONTAM: hypothetical protein Slati_3782300 [Sesamum latifolium]|uniref:Uncharacterized protein n=1 Tax=Sesamum latifolium TaxID=2727402 RepID=A0AAW2U8I2_9LAMI